VLQPNENRWLQEDLSTSIRNHLREGELSLTEFDRVLPMVMKRTLSVLPDVTTLRRKAQALAVLDAIMSPDRHYRYYSFNSSWDTDEMMAARKNGSGDELYVLFNASGAILKGFDHESFMSPWAREDQSLWPRIFDLVPSEFTAFLREPAFDLPNTTFCIWRRNRDASWHAGNIEYPDGDENSDGSEEQLALFAGGPELYVRFAEEYFDQAIPLGPVVQIYRHEVLTETIVKQLNPRSDLASLELDLAEIGYPSA
jgi:hypothetical protein